MNSNENILPEKYLCSECRATDCKLWRESFVHGSKLLCARCAARLVVRLTGAPELKISADGTHPAEHGPTDMIGHLVPAMPIVGLAYGDPKSFVTREICQQWRALPTYILPV